MKIESSIDPRSEPFQANRAAMAEGGGAKYVERHKERGKLLPRERVALAPFTGTAKT